MIFKATNIQNSKGIQGKPRKGQRPTRQHKCQREIKAKGKLRQTKGKATRANQAKKRPIHSKTNEG